MKKRGVKKRDTKKGKPGHETKPWPCGMNVVKLVIREATQESMPGDQRKFHRYILMGLLVTDEPLAVVGDKVMEGHALALRDVLNGPTRDPKISICGYRADQIITSLRDV